MVKCRLFVLIFIFAPVLASARLTGRARIDSLLAVLPSCKADTNKVNVLNNIAYAYGFISPEKGMVYARQGLQLAKQLKWQKGIANAYNSLYSNFANTSQLDSALYYTLMSLEINEKLGNKRSVAVNLGNAANVYEGRSNFTKALEFQFKSLALKEELKDKMLIATSLMNIGNIYLEMGNMPKQMEYHMQALKTYEEAADTDGIAQCYLNIGNDYYLQKDYARALDYFFKTLELSQRSGKTMQTQKAIGNIGSTYQAMENYPLALEYSFRSLEMCQKSGDKEGVYYGFTDIGCIYLALAQHKGNAKLPDSLAGLGKNALLQRAVTYLKSSIDVNDRGNNQILLYQTLKNLSEAYGLMGNYKMAFDNYKAYTDLKDSVFSVDNKIKVAQFETQRESDLKEKQIEINRLSKIEEREKQQFLLGGITLLLFVVGIVIRANKKQKKANEQLAAEKETSEKLRGNLEETLVQKNQLMDQLSVAADMKSKFIANISHELRTPVTLLTGMLEMMKEEDSTANGTKMEVAYNNSRRLQNMVDEILDLSKLDRYEDTLKKRVRELVPLVKRIVYTFSSFIEQQQLTFQYEDNGISGIFISTDEEKFEKIINNLVYNAIKFNKPHGRIKVELLLSADNKYINIVISDTGVGIEPNDLSHIFQRYYQGKLPNIKAKGSGIGLSLVKEFTEMLGGTVQVTSEVAKGTTFTLVFPVSVKAGENSEETADHGQPIEDWGQFERTNSVLLVEDNAEMRYYLREILSKKVDLSEAENGRKALEWLQDNQPDLIITDIMMPEMDGREFISVLKSTDEYKKIPVITLSALADIESQLHTLRLGIDDYIVKPFNAMELRIRIYNLLKNLQERRSFNLQPKEPDDIAADSQEAEKFKAKLNDYVLSRIKNYNVTVFDIAYEFSLSERQLYRLAKSLTGCTPAQLIKEARLQKAYELLISGDVHKMDTLAKEVGFEHVSYFSKQFFDRFGKKPTEFL